MIKESIISTLLLLTLNVFAQKADGHIYSATHYGHTYKTIRKTANGEIFNKDSMTCAAPRHIKFGTLLEVTNLSNGKSVVVRVNDRGSFGNKTIDLTHGAFKKISNHKSGKIKVKVKAIHSHK